MRPWTPIVSNCSVGVGLSDGSLHAAFLTGVTRARLESTSRPMPFLTMAVAILSGTQKGLRLHQGASRHGNQNRVRLDEGGEWQLSHVLLNRSSINSDIGIGGCSMKSSVLMAFITAVARCISLEEPRGV